MSAVIDSSVVGAPSLGFPSDEHLISRLRAQDGDAFAMLVTRYERQLLSFCRRLLGSHEDAEDVLQDTFAAAYQAILADDRVIECRPWLYQIARNRCLNAIRGRRQTQPLAVGDLEQEAPLGPADYVANRVELETLVGDILALPDQQRKALVLHELEGCSYVQIGHHLGTSVASVRSLLLRARRTLSGLAEARGLSCAEVRMRLEESSSPAAAVRRHAELCSECGRYRRQLKRRPARVLRALSPLGAVPALKNFVLGKVLGQAGPSGVAGGAGAAGAGGAASVGAGGVATAGAGLSGAVVKTLAGLAVLAAAGTGTVVTQQASTGGQHHARPPATLSSPAVPTQSTSPALVVVPSPPVRTAAPVRSAAAAKVTPSPAPASPAPPASSTAPPAPPTAPGSPASQGTSGVQTTSSPTTVARTRPTSGSGVTPARTRPLPVQLPNSSRTLPGSSSPNSSQAGFPGRVRSDPSSSSSPAAADTSTATG
ncbi:MAG TPA: sigma-70 family RNA polymerase sigma factor [Solirubrobacteraceae bacterium]|nr:sigma-70 family RNA polymerase sigma factor [Solirubrobacteraceae bacterium]